MVVFQWKTDMARFYMRLVATDRCGSNPVMWAQLPTPDYQEGRAEVLRNEALNDSASMGKGSAERTGRLCRASRLATPAVSGYTRRKPSAGLLAVQLSGFLIYLLMETSPNSSVGVEGISAVSIQTWELMGYVVTVIGLPLAIVVYLLEQRKERENEEEEVYQLLSDSYQDFLKVALENPDLRLFSVAAAPSLNDEQKERQLIIYAMLIALFERAYLLLYEEAMSPQQARRWNSWEDYILEWCRKPHFQSCLPQLLCGEDPSFVRYLEQLPGARRDT